MEEKCIEYLYRNNGEQSTEETAEEAPEEEKKYYSFIETFRHAYTDYTSCKDAGS